MKEFIGFILWVVCFGYWIWLGGQIITPPPKWAEPVGFATVPLIVIGALLMFVKI